MQQLFLQTNERKVAVVGLLLWCAFLITYVFGDSILIRIILGFPVLILLPGVLILQNCKIPIKFDWTYTGLSVGLSVGSLMIFGLAINMLLPLVSITPLVGSVLIWCFTGLFILLSIIPIVRNNEIQIEQISFSYTDLLLIITGIFFVIWSVIGALRLNNGHTGIVTLLMLYAMSMFFALLVFYSGRIKENILACVMYFSSLSLLLMTSLRGWDIVGHDIQREYRVFQLTKEAGVWSVDYLVDAYNACMSITILPTILAELLSIPDVYIYKILFQIIFALVPVISFLLFLKYFTKPIALLSAITIISFPTFFTDMPMLNRQEIAFLMFILMIFVMFDNTLGKKIRNALILFFGIGIILSHYSTTYIVILFLLTSYLGFWLFKLSSKTKPINAFLINRKYFGKTFELSNRPVIPLFVLIIIIVSSFTWSNIFTQTSDDSIKRVLLRTLDSVIHDSESSKSVDTLYSIFSTKKMSREEIFASYKMEVIDSARSRLPEDTFYNEADIKDYFPTFAPDAILGLNPLGEKITSFGINVTELNMQLKFGSAKVLQLLLLIGLAATIFTARYFRNKPKVEYLFLACAGILFLASMVVIPVLSVEYGVLRAFQQSLLIVAPFIVIGGLCIFSIFGRRWTKVLTTVFVLGFFLISTGAVTQTLGGYKALLHLNNEGPYYDYYYLHESEIKGLNWLNEQAEKSTDSFFQSEVQSDRYLSKKLMERSTAGNVNDIYPSLIRQKAFVFLGYSNVRENNATLYHAGVLLNYKYPNNLLDIYKNKVYDSEGVIIYR